MDGSINKTYKIDGLSLEELIYENERRRFRIEDGEFIRGFLSHDGIVFMMHHLGGDGKYLQRKERQREECRIQRQRSF